MKLFIWDLHGTLEQGNEYAAIEMSNAILADFGYQQRFDQAHALQLYGLKWYQYFEFLLPDEPAERHTELQAACFEFSNGPAGIAMIAKHMRPSKNALGILDRIHSTHEQLVISNTIPASLSVFINALQMQTYFQAHNALAINQHARGAKKTKQDALEEYIGNKQYDKLVVIGDSNNDMLLASAIGAKGYLYAHTGTPFRSELGDYRIRDLKKLACEL